MSIRYVPQGLTAQTACALRLRCGLPALDEAALTRALHGSLYTLTAYDGETPVGMARLLGDGRSSFCWPMCWLSPHIAGSASGQA